MKQRADGASSTFGSCITTALPLPKKPTTVSVAASSGTEQHSGSTWSLPTRLYFPAGETRTGSQSFKSRAVGIVTGTKNSTLSASNETLLPGFVPGRRATQERTEFLQFQSENEGARGAATPKIATHGILGKDGTLGLSFCKGKATLAGNWRIRLE